MCLCGTVGMLFSALCMQDVRLCFVAGRLHKRSVPSSNGRCPFFSVRSPSNNAMQSHQDEGPAPPTTTPSSPGLFSLLLYDIGHR